MKIEVKEAVEIYEKLHKEATKNVVASGVEHLSFELCDWHVMDNPHNMARDLHITYRLNSYDKTLTVRYDELSLHARGENNMVKVGRMVADKIREKLAEHVAAEMGNSVFRGCATQLIR